MTLKQYLKHNITQVVFAKQIGISGPYLSQILHGKRTPSKYVALMIEAKSNGVIKARSFRDDIKPIR